MKIRIENEHDYNAVYGMVKRAFDTTSFSDGTEADYLNKVRKEPSFIPELSLVAIENEMTVGQVVFYKTEIDTPNGAITQLILSPLSVEPAYFRRGIGTSLVNEGCKRAASLGYKAVFLCGSPGYYSRFGFTPTYTHGIYHVKDADRNAQWCMVKELEAGYLSGITGYIDIE